MTNIYNLSIASLQNMCLPKDTIYNGMKKSWKLGQSAKTKGRLPMLPSEALILDALRVNKVCPKISLPNVSDKMAYSEKTQIELLLKEPSDQGLHCLPFH